MITTTNNIDAVRTHIIQGTTRDGEVVFYTGRAGDGWVSADRSQAFPYIEELAQSNAQHYDSFSGLHGIAFEAVLI